MKKYFALFAAAATVLVAAVSCAKENLSAATEEEQMVEMTVIASEKPESPAALQVSRTYLEGTKVKWSASGEYLHIIEVATPAEGDAVPDHKSSSEGYTADGGATMSFGVSFSEPATAASFDYYAIYPHSALNSFSSINNISVNTPSSQTPSATSFDPSADLLIAKKVEAGSTRPTSISMQFARMVAIGKMTVKNLGTTDEIERITFTAKNGDKAVSLAGRTSFDLTTGLPVDNYAPTVQFKSIILNYSGQGITANSSTGMVAYFISYPFSLEAGDSFKVEVETATQIFTKEVNLAENQILALKEGKSSVFAVDMGGILGVTKGVDLPYAFMDFADYSATEGAKGSYNITTTTKSHGDNWEAFAMKSGNSISLRNASTTNDSYIKLPNFINDIKTVKVTLNSVTSEKTLTLENIATAKTGTVAKVTTSEELVYTFDLTSKSVKTAYLRSADFNGLVSKIEVWAGTDTRSAISAPASVTASLNEDDASVTNSIDVSWANVNEAGSFIVTLTPPSPAEPVSCECYGTSHTFENLLYETSYSVSVVAVPMDPYVKKNSVTALAGSPVVTGAELSKKYIVVFNSTTMLSSINNYTSTWDNTSGGLTISLSNFSNNYKKWSLVKCGIKDVASVGTITTAVIKEAISKVTVTIDAIVVENVKSVKLYVDTVSSFNSASLQTVNLAPIETGDKEFRVVTPTANCYYKLEFDCASGSSNGLVTVSKIVYEE